MRTCLVLLLLVALVFCDKPRGNIWPDPQNYSVGTINAIIPDPTSFAIKADCKSQESCDFIQRQIQRYTKLIFYDQSIQASSCASPNLCLTSLLISVQTPNMNLDLSTDESYSLDISSAQILISAQSVFGALRALETLSQIIVVSNKQYITAYQAPIQVADAPRFAWRGLLVDTSRHFISVKMLKKVIDGLSYLKMNVFHWHVIDDQSFPLVVPELPELSSKGAYAKQATYSPEQVQDIIQYAYERGVKVMIELDMPGHSAGWAKAFPEICSPCKSAMTPANPKTFDVVSKVIEYVSKVNPNSFIHFGGDELDITCWKEDPALNAWMKTKGFTTYDEVLGYFEQFVIKTYQQYNKTMVCWQELLLNYNHTIINLPKDTIVQAWINPKALIPIVQQGYRALLSAGWYFDQQYPSAIPHYEWEDTWKDFYVNDPYNASNFTHEEEQLILGGEGCVWGEQNDDMSTESRIFPRVLAVAERLWSPQSTNILDSVTISRLEHQRCNLVRRGIRAGPVMPGVCDASYTVLSK